MGEGPGMREDPEKIAGLCLWAEAERKLAREVPELARNENGLMTKVSALVRRGLRVYSSRAQA